ncbi:winged helix-turn-helix transcriptional regulator [Halocatena salina]|uniref:Winged helix-turn-helix transcriptional regulator n=1 Tax=Halocatena salina TaxID=2934340 RepID=A0A8U0A342_9EURY|nr:winged helix-turn-helix transcriptional regulator [Halocatena salina]UPM42397.1 winged helix-turn-helix transcriptional regulator [Halocatena salina]
MVDESSESVDTEKRATLRRFAALGAAGPLSRLVDSSSSSDVRDAIVGYLSTTPGAHFSKIRDDLSLGTGETQHHLRRLVDSHAIESFRDGEYRRYVEANRFSEYEKVALGYLRRETARGMFIVLLRDPNATASDIAHTLDVSRPTVSKYAKELEAAALLSRENGYAVERPETMLTLLVQYADSFGEDAVALAVDADSLIQYDPPSSP